MLLAMLEPVDRPADAPAWHLYLTDIPRAGLEYGQLLSVLPLQRALPTGDGHPVLVLPGLLAGDGSTWILRRILSNLGYQAYGWGIGRNIGPTPEAVAGMTELLAELNARYDAPVSVIGWSLGGIFARNLARSYPSLVRQVITLGSPFALVDPRQSRADRAFRKRDHLHAASHRVPSRERVRQPIPVPSTAVYSRLDGIVSWRACVEPTSVRHQNVAVRCSHLGFGVDPATLWLTADRLAQPEPGRRPFQPPLWLRALYPMPR